MIITREEAARLVAEGKAKHDAKTNTVTIDLGVLGSQMLQVTAADIANAEATLIAEADVADQAVADKKQEIEMASAEIDRLSKDAVRKRAKADFIKSGKAKQKVK